MKKLLLLVSLGVMFSMEAGSVFAERLVDLRQNIAGYSVDSDGFVYKPMS